MTLRATEIESLTREVREFAQQQSEHDLFEALRVAIDALDRPVTRLVSVSQTLGDTALGAGATGINTEAVRSAVAECLDHLGENWDPRGLRDSGALTRLRGSLEALVETLEETASTQWREHVRQHPVPKIGELADLLRQLDLEDIALELLKIRNAVSRMERAASAYPTHEVFERYMEDLVVAQKGASKIGLDDAWPPSVTSFLRSAAAQGAELTALTDEVLAWINEHQLAGHFRVVPKSE